MNAPRPILHRQQGVPYIDPATIARLNGEDDALYRAVHPEMVERREQFQATVHRQLVMAQIAIGVALFTAAYFIGQLIRWAVSQ